MSTIRTRDGRRWAEGLSSCVPSDQRSVRVAGAASGARSAAGMGTGARSAAAAALVLVMLALALCLAGLSGIAAPQSAFVDSPFAAEVAFADELAGSDAAATEVGADGTVADEAAVDAEGEEAAPDEELVTEEIEDDEVPLAAAVGAGRSIKQAVIIGIVVVACAFALFMRRVNHNMDTMRHRFR